MPPKFKRLAMQLQYINLLKVGLVTYMRKVTVTKRQNVSQRK